MVWEELRTAVRFPMHLPVTLMINGEQFEAATVNISNNGVLLESRRGFPEKTELEFLLDVPKEVTLDESTAAIHCVGYVIRSYSENGVHYIAAVIDEYRFQ